MDCTAHGYACAYPDPAMDRAAHSHAYTYTEQSRIRSKAASNRHTRTDRHPFADGFHIQTKTASFPHDHSGCYCRAHANCRCCFRNGDHQAPHRGGG